MLSQDQIEEEIKASIQAPDNNVCRPRHPSALYTVFCDGMGIRSRKGSEGTQSLVMAELGGK